MPFNLAKTSGANFISTNFKRPKKVGSSTEQKPQAHKTFVVFEILLSFKSMTYFGNLLEA